MKLLDAREIKQVSGANWCDDNAGAAAFGAGLAFSLASVPSPFSAEFAISGAFLGFTSYAFASASAAGFCGGWKGGVITINQV